MKILAFDCATHTGWSMIEDGVLVESGVQDFSKKRGESNGLMFLRFRKWIEELCDMVAPDLFCYERAHHRGGAATEICTNLTGIVQECAAKHNRECATVPTTTLKKWATDNGRAGKEDMINAAEELTGHACESDDEADAILIGLWAASQYQT